MIYFSSYIFLIIFHVNVIALSTKKMAGKTNEGPVWCENKQIYVGGVPENEEVQKLIEENEGHLRVFGYGSLCWNPGFGVLSKPGVSTSMGHTLNYKRVWSQRSTDHRGTPKFPGIVCTLLTKQEYASVLASDASLSSSSMNRKITDSFNANLVTNGIIFNVPPELVREALEELDFREKGGYARDVCEVVEEETKKSYKALLYRGIPDNPAFSSRALLDLPFSAAIMSASVGPSGANDIYLNKLNTFLRKTYVTESNDDTNMLVDMVRSFQEKHQLYFLSGGGSNQHNQLLLNRPQNSALLVGEDAHTRKEIVMSTSLCTDDESKESCSPIEVYAGGGHSGILTKNGRLFLWGWNEDMQCGKKSIVSRSHNNNQLLPIIEPLCNLVVEKASLGFSHTLVVEKHTKQLYAFGNNERGQVTGRQAASVHDVSTSPTIPEFLKGEKIDIVRAGLFHSAVITKRGELITFGCNRFGQSNFFKGDENFLDTSESLTYKYRRWKPTDADRVVDVACGRRHTVVVDSLNRVWTFGENKYGQLGRKTIESKGCSPSVVSMEGIIKRDDIVSVYCGWSHTIIQVESPGGKRFFGFGRNDKGQLGFSPNIQEYKIIELFTDRKIRSIQCGSESTMVIDTDGQLLGCGWNEHGNLGTGNQEDSFTLSLTMGAKSVTPPDIMQKTGITLAVGGAHYLTAAVSI